MMGRKDWQKPSTRRRGYEDGEVVSIYIIQILTKRSLIGGVRVYLC